jgi:hypothetical protein
VDNLTTQLSGWNITANKVTATRMASLVNNNQDNNLGNSRNLANNLANNLVLLKVNLSSDDVIGK